MLHLTIRISLTLLIVAACCCTSAAQAAGDDPAVVASALRAGRMLEKRQWNAAEKLFDSLAQANPRSENLPQLLFGRAKALFHSGRTREASAEFDNLLDRFPSSYFAPYASYFSANCRFQLGEIVYAIKLYIAAYAESDDAQLQGLVIGSLSAFDPTAVIATASSIDRSSLTPTKRSQLGEAMASALEHQGQAAKGKQYRNWIQGIVTDSPKPNRGGVAPARLLRIAVVAPLSGELQAFGEDLYNGAVIGASAAQEENSCTVQLTPFDTKGDRITAARIVRDISPQNFDAIVGPLTSDEASVVSAALGCGNFPIVIPAATDAGLTLLSPASFQLSPNLELQGALMAEYAVRMLAADSAAVIAPTSGEAASMTQAFVDRFKSLGGTVVAVEQYRDRDKDFASYIRDIKDVILGRIPDSAVYLDDRGDTLETEAVPAHVDCLYIPGSPDRVRQLLTQLRFYNLAATYLGSDSWGDESIYNLSADVTRNALFPSSFVTVSQSAAATLFASRYSAKYGRKPQRVASLAYDAVRLLASASAQTGSGTRESLPSAVKRISGFDGAAGKVTFGAHRENIELPIYRIVAGRPVPVELDAAVLQSIKSSR